MDIHWRSEVKQSELAFESFFLQSYGITNNMISQELMLFEAWSIKQELFVFNYLINIRDEAGWLGLDQP